MVRLRKSQLLKMLEDSGDLSHFSDGVLTGELPKGPSRTIIITLENRKIKRILFDDEEEGPSMVEGEALEEFLSYFFIREFVAGTKLRWTWEAREPERSGQFSTG
jgi:hypothetical protein